MRSIIALLVVGALAGAFTLNKHHTDKQAKLESEYRAAIIHRDKITNRLSDEYYKLSKEADDRAPTIVPERVFVRAKSNCVRTATNPSMGDGGDAARVELDQRVVRGIAEVGDRHKKAYEKCSAALRFHQERSSQ